MDGLIFENGAAFNTVTADKDGHIRADLNDAFAAQVRSLGTSGEYFLVGGIVNTLLDAFDGTDVTLTVNGAPLESGHNIYDYALTRYEELTYNCMSMKKKGLSLLLCAALSLSLAACSTSRKLRHSPRGGNPRAIPVTAAPETTAAPTETPAAENRNVPVISRPVRERGFLYRRQCGASSRLCLRRAERFHERKRRGRCRDQRSAA